MKLTPIKAIRLKCLDCCCNSANEVKACRCNTCASRLADVILVHYTRIVLAKDLEAMREIEKEHSYLGAQDENDED